MAPAASAIRPPRGEARLPCHEGGMDTPPFALLGGEHGA
jgi:hypothetical protein